MTKQPAGVRQLLGVLAFLVGMGSLLGCSTKTQALEPSLASKAGKVAGEEIRQPPRTVDYEKLNNADSLAGLPKEFRKVIVEGDATCATNIIYAKGMPTELLEDVVAGLLPAGKVESIIHRVVKNEGFGGVADPFYAHTYKGRHLRYLIYPTHILQVIRFYGGGPDERWFYLSLTEDGIKVVGVKYAEIIETQRK